MLRLQAMHSLTIYAWQQMQDYLDLLMQTKATIKMVGIPMNFQPIYMKLLKPCLKSYRLEVLKPEGLTLMLKPDEILLTLKIYLLHISQEWTYLQGHW